MLTEDGRRTRSHGLRRQIIEAQARRLGLPLHTASASWADYEEQYLRLLECAAERGASAVVFGDIDSERHRRWNDSVCRRAGLTAYLPLWKEDRRELLSEFWSLGFEARIVVLRKGRVDRALLGSILDPIAVESLAQQEVDLCGENGEYHTLVTDGPVFSSPIQLSFRRQVLRGGCWVQDVSLRAR